MDINSTLRIYMRLCLCENLYIYPPGGERENDNEPMNLTPGGIFTMNVFYIFISEIKILYFSSSSLVSGAQSVATRAKGSPSGQKRLLLEQRGSP